MKVILINGSPHIKGCTYTALNEIANTLNECNVDIDFFHIGGKPITGCTGCGNCRELGRCVFNDSVNNFLDIAEGADGYIFGSPVYYASANGALIAFMDRVFYASGYGSKTFYLKPAASVVSARRAGTTSAIDQINKYFMLMQMPVISSRYWNMVHGNTPDEVLKDKEGLQIMRILARNMAWFLECKNAGEKVGVLPPESEQTVLTNFIR